MSQRSWRLTWWIVVVVLIAAGWDYFDHRSPDPLEAFNALFYLTPDALKRSCGAPQADQKGVVTDGDGIWDMYYRDENSNDIVFRFTAGHEEEWESVGAWTGVKSGSDLGAPLDPVEVVRGLSCVARTLNSETSRIWMVPQVERSKARFILSSQQVPEPPPTGPDVHPDAGPSGVTGQPGSQSGIGSIDTSGIGPVKTLESNGSLGGGGGGGSGGGGDGIRQIPLPCPPDLPLCQAVDYSEFVADMTQAITAEQDNKFDRVTDLLSSHHVIVVDIPELEVNKQEFIQEIFHLEAQIINAVTERLRDDISKLSPFQYDTPQQKAAKLQVVMHDDLVRRQTWKRAIIESRDEVNHPSHNSSSRCTSYRFDSEAYRQAVQIHVTGNWPQ